MVTRSSVVFARPCTSGQKSPTLGGKKGCAERSSTTDLELILPYIQVHRHNGIAAQ